MVLVLRGVVSVVGILERAVVRDVINRVLRAQVHHLEAKGWIVFEHIEEKLLAMLSREHQVSLVVVELRGRARRNHPL